MLSITEIVDLYREQGYPDWEIDDMVSRHLAEQKQQFIEDYDNDPIVWDGWRQQDIIDMYRRER